MIAWRRGGRSAARRVILAGLCSIAGACSTSPANDFARMDVKGRSLVSQQKWEEALRVSEPALAKCDQTDWCSKDPRYQGLFHNTIGEALEHLGKRDEAMKHYRAAFYAYPLFFTENYFRLLRDAGMFRQLRHEIDVKLANNEAAARSASAFWLPSEGSACGGRRVAGNYSWRLRASGGIGGLSGKVAVSQQGCAVAADFASPEEQAAGKPLRLRGDVGTGAVVVLYGLPCMTSDKGQIAVQQNGFSLSVDRTAVITGCPRGPYAIEFVRE